jgi:hypothetical protein
MDGDMNTRKSVAVVSLVAVALLTQTAAIFAETATAKLHLPREVTVKDKNIRLGDIAIASGDETLIRKAQDVRLGNIAAPGQAVVLDRYTIMTRLGSSGIDVSDITLTGAEKVSVTLVRSVITSAELMGTAEKFASRYPLPADQRLHAMAMPADVNLTTSAGKIDVVPSLVSKKDESPLVVRLVVSQGGKETAVREVRFASVPRNARAAAAASARPAVPADAPKVVFRNQPVVIEIESSCLTVTAMGLPLEDGKVGQLIKVRNMDSKRDIIAKVRQDGTVSPVL